MTLLLSKPLRRLAITAALVVGCGPTQGSTTKRNEGAALGHLEQGIRSSVAAPAATAQSGPLNVGVFADGHPRVFFSAERRRMFERMKAEQHPWWEHIKRRANETATADEDWNERGQWAALAFQITGDRSYVSKGWDVIRRKLIERGKHEPTAVVDGSSVPSDRNVLREYYVDYVVIYDWLYPGLDPDQRARFLTALNEWADFVLGRHPFEGKLAIRLTDSDEVFGFYFGLMGMDLLTTPENSHPLAGSFIRGSFHEADANTTLPIGGLDATGVDRRTMRNTLRQYAEMAEGGEWFESSMYNMNSVATIAFGVEMARTVTGNDHFPEYTRLYEQFALSYMATMVPELCQRYQWGDEQDPRYLLAGPLEATVGMVGALARLTNPSVSALSLGFFDDLAAVGDGNGNHPSSPYSRLFFVYDPYAEKIRDWRAKAPLHHFASGQGLMIVHDQWRPGRGPGSGSSLFGAHFPPGTRVDHQQLAWGNFQLWRKGEWAITHPTGYGPATFGAATNSMLLYGLPGMREQRIVVGHEYAEDGSYAYLAGTNSGRYYYTSDRDTPGFLDEWTRSLVYLPSRDQSVDTVVIVDRVRFNEHAPPNPDQYFSYDGWNAGSDRHRMRAAAHPMQWRLHVPEKPKRLDTSTLVWSTRGDGRGIHQTVKLSHLLPERIVWEAVNEQVLWGPNKSTPGDLLPEEKKFHILLSPADDASRWQIFLNVIHAYDDTLEPLTTLLVSAGPACGVLLGRRAQPDTLLLFGCARDERRLVGPLSIRFLARAAITSVMLFDLDPKRSWRVSVDGRPSNALHLAKGGAARLVLKGAGKHMVNVE